MKFKTTQKKKKPYRPPRVVVYGDFRTLTQTGKGGSKADGAGVPKSRQGQALPTG